MITDPSWRWRRQKKLPDLFFAFVDSRGIVGQRQVLLFSMFSFPYGIVQYLQVVPLEEKSGG